MESRGRRTPRMAAPADNSAVPAPEPPEPPKIDRRAEESAAPPGVIPEPLLVVPETIPERALPPVAAPAVTAAATPDATIDIFDIIAASRSALARGVESLGDEFASFARQSIDATAQTAIRLLGVKTWADAVAVNTSFARTSFNHWVDSTAKVSELGVKLTVDSSRPFVSKLGEVWSGPRPSR